MSNTTEKSPIQRRLAIDRIKAIGLTGIILGALFTPIAVWLYVASGLMPLRLTTVAICFVVLISGVSQRRRAAKLAVELEREHGAGAGVQRPRLR